MSAARETDPAILSAQWGALWASALGVWLVAPPLIAAHHLHPHRVTEWLVLFAGLLIAFGIAGLLLGAVAGFVPLTIETLSRRSLRHRAWAYGLSVGPLVLVEYLGESLLIHWYTSDTVSITSYYGRQLVLLGSALAVATSLLVWLYRRVLIPRHIGTSWLAWTLGAATMAGLMILIPSVPDAPAPVTVTLQRDGEGGNAPLLFIGLDGATWRVLEPAIESGSAPTFRRLTETGVHGATEALWPPYWSSAAWASILTGLPQDVTGVYEDLEGSGAGLPSFQVPQLPTLALSPMFVLRGVLLRTGAIRFTPPARPLLNGTPVWQLLHNAGVNTAVVRFRFTYPPDHQADVVISDWAGHDEWEGLGVQRTMGPDTVAPRDRATELLAPFLEDDSSTRALFASLLPGPPPSRPADALADPIEALRASADIDERTFEAAESLLRRNPAQPFLAVYIGGLDSVEHAFWQYRFPDDFQTNRPAASDVKRLGPVVDRYVHYVDDRLARLLARYSEPPNVVIVSDHGHGAGTVPSNWRGWHTRDGFFVAAGPGVPHRTASINVSYYDVLPTLAQLKGFRASTLTGHSVLEHPAPASRAE